MLSRVTVNIIRRMVCNNARTLCYLRDPLQSDLWSSSDAKPHSVQNHCNLYVAKRFKSSRKKAANIVINIIYLVSFLLLYLFVSPSSIDKYIIFGILQKENRDEDSDENSDEEMDDKVTVSSKVTKVKISSLRLDTVSKVGFGISRKYA